MKKPWLFTVYRGWKFLPSYIRDYFISLYKDPYELWTNQDDSWNVMAGFVSCCEKLFSPGCGEPRKKTKGTIGHLAPTFWDGDRVVRMSWARWTRAQVNVQSLPPSKMLQKQGGKYRRIYIFPIYIYIYIHYIQLFGRNNSWVCVSCSLHPTEKGTNKNTMQTDPGFFRHQTKSPTFTRAWQLRIKEVSVWYCWWKESYTSWYGEYPICHRVS